MTGAEALIAVPAVAGGALGLIDASGQRSAAKRSAASVQAAALAQAHQLENKANQTLYQNNRDAAQVLGRLATAASANGTELSDAIKINLATDKAYNDNVIRLNLANERLMLQTGAQANVANIYGNLRSPFSSVFGGALQGLQIGMSLTNAGNMLDEAARRGKTPDLVPQMMEVPTLSGSYGGVRTY